MSSIKKTDILVSISCITYNQKPYVKDCFEGFLSQKTNFNYEILVNDDASTDGTVEIIKYYENKYPSIFKIIYQNENQYSKGVRGMHKTFNFNRSKGKYIAVCDGDDYWKDPLKLQKQVDFLENNKKYAFTFHAVYVKNEIPNLKYSYPTPPKAILNFNDILKKHYIPTCSLVFNKKFLPKPTPEFLNNCSMADIPLELLLANNGRIYYMNKEMAVYRKHQNSITLKPSQIINGRKNYIYVYYNVLKYIFPKHFFPLCLKLALTSIGFLKDYFKKL